jgi:hypothetical protein
MRNKVSRAIYGDYVNRSTRSSQGCYSLPVPIGGDGAASAFLDSRIGARNTTVDELDTIKDVAECPATNADLTYPFTPDEIRSLIMWLDAADVITEGEGTVTQWNDRSGKGNHATIPTTTSGPTPSGPTYVSADLNEMPGIVFNSSFNGSSNGSSDVLAASGIVNTSDFTVLCVGRFTSNVGIGEHCILSSFTKLRVNATNIIYKTTNFLSVGYPYLVNTTRMWSIVAKSNSDGTSLTAGINGSVTTNSTYLEDSTVDTGFVIGAKFASGSYTSFGEVHINEIVAFENNLTPELRQKVEGYLAHKWGVANNLPEGHPWKSVAP